MPNPLKSFAPTWKGELVLVCRKCQKKLKGQHGMRALVKLKKAVKRRNQEHPGKELHILNVPCMKFCPKGAVTVCRPADPKIFLLRSEGEIEELYRADPS